MFIGVLHDNSDMARVKRLAGALLGMDISAAMNTGVIPIEKFMNAEDVKPRYPMCLTCFYTPDVDEIDSMALIMATEFFGDMKTEFTRAMAKREIGTRTARIDAQKDGTLKAYFAQFKEPRDIYWNFLGFLALTHDSITDITIGTAELDDETCAIIHYSESLIGNSYVRGFENGRRQGMALALAEDPAFSNVTVFPPKK